MKILKIGLALLGCGCLALVNANAIDYNLAVGLSDSRAIGDVIPGLLGSGQADDAVSMVNTLISMNLNTQSGGSPNYQRSNNPFIPLPDATKTGDVVTPIANIILSGGSAVISLSQGFRYLVAVYDGPEGGAQVWDIADIGAGNTINIPANAEPTGGGGSLEASTRFGISAWTLLNPTTPPSVPDGGTTMMLLGSALASLGAIARRVKE